MVVERTGPYSIRDGAIELCELPAAHWQDKRAVGLNQFLFIYNGKKIPFQADSGIRHSKTDDKTYIQWKIKCIGSAFPDYSSNKSQNKYSFEKIEMNKKSMKLIEPIIIKYLKHYKIRNMCPDGNYLTIGDSRRSVEIEFVDGL